MLQASVDVFLQSNISPKMDGIWLQQTCAAAGQTLFWGGICDTARHCTTDSLAVVIMPVIDGDGEGS